MTPVDTAEMYGGGVVEQIVGDAIRGRRDEVFLVSKVLPSNATYRGTVEACERSLRRLRTHWPDLYLLHSPNYHPLHDPVKGLPPLIDEGKNPAFGVSNLDGHPLHQANALRTPGHHPRH